jgi:hypothetical protein
VRRELLMFALVSFATICMADDAQNPVPGAAAASQRAARPRQVAVGQRSTEQAPVSDGAAGGAASGAPDGTSNGATNRATDSATAGNSAAADAPKFVSEAKWVLAGYNSDEIVYTVFVTNQDARIIRCTTEVKGFYFENGAKLSISDRQITTVFPNQPTRVGYWMDMDQQSGATYSVKCHPV